MRADSDVNAFAAFLVRFLRVAGKVSRKIRGGAPHFHLECTDLKVDSHFASNFPNVLYGETASDLIYELLADDKPRFICRFGAVELAVMSSAQAEFSFGNALKLLTGDILVRDIGIHPGLVRSLCTSAGFFPPDISHVRDFVSLMDNLIPEIDALGVWCKQEVLIAEKLSAAKKIRFRDLEPYFYDRPWSRVLKGKKVLVIHPFAETIEAQYREKRAQIFSNPLVLPEFDLIALKAVQSIANNPTEFSSWFEALESMKSKVLNIDFDVAIIGCGAYGMPLGAFCKKIGKKAIHLGGQTQLLFGIKGKRWETGHDEIQKLFNDAWVYPAAHDRPTGYKRIEGGAYW